MIKSLVYSATSSNFVENYETNKFKIDFLTNIF